MDGLSVSIAAAAAVETLPGDVRPTNQSDHGSGFIAGEFAQTLAGYGVTPENLRDYWTAADAFIIGSWLKRDGQWYNEPDPLRLAAMFSAFGAMRAP